MSKQETQGRRGGDRPGRHDQRQWRTASPPGPRSTQSRGAPRIACQASGRGPDRDEGEQGHESDSPTRASPARSPRGVGIRVDRRPTKPDDRGLAPGTGTLAADKRTSRQDARTAGVVSGPGRHTVLGYVSETSVLRRAGLRKPSVCVRRLEIVTWESARASRRVCAGAGDPARGDPTRPSLRADDCPLILTIVRRPATDNSP